MTKFLNDRYAVNYAEREFFVIARQSQYIMKMIAGSEVGNSHKWPIQKIPCFYGKKLVETT